MRHEPLGRGLFHARDRQEITPGRPIPLYHQVYSLLRRRIESGELRQGSQLPGEAELAQALGVSRITSKRALDELERDGLVARQRGRGTRVTFRYQPKILRAPLNAMLEGLAVMGRETTIDVIAFERVEVPHDLVDVLGLREHAKVDRAKRVRCHDGLPFAYYVSWTIPLGPGYHAAALRGQARLEVFRSLGVVIREVDQVLSARGADAEAAAALAIGIGEPLLSVARTYKDAAGRPIDHLLGLYRPDRFQYHMLLTSRR